MTIVTNEQFGSEGIVFGIPTKKKVRKDVTKLTNRKTVSVEVTTKGGRKGRKN